MNQHDFFMPPSAADGYVRHCFAADDIDLLIDMAESASDPASSSPLYAAIALAECDALLQCVSNWLGRDFNWQVVDTTKDQSKIDFTLTAKHDRTNQTDVANKSHGSARIGLAFRQVQPALPEFPDQLSAQVSIHAHCQAVRLCVAAVALEKSELEKLGQGSCVLLPDTFEKTFVVQLYEKHSKACISSAILDCDAHCLRPVLFPVTGPCSESKVRRGGANHNENESDENTPATKVLRFVLNQDVQIDFPAWHQAQVPCSAGDASNAVSAVNVAIPVLAGQAVMVEQAGLSPQTARLIRVGDGLGALFDTKLSS